MKQFFAVPCEYAFAWIKCFRANKSWLKLNTITLYRRTWPAVINFYMFHYNSYVISNQIRFTKCASDLSLEKVKHLRHTTLGQAQPLTNLLEGEIVNEIPSEHQPVLLGIG